MSRFGPAVTPPQVWAVEDTALQIVWGDLPAGSITARGGGAEAEIEHEGGPGAIDLEGLQPDTEVVIDLRTDGGSIPLIARTLPAPPGELLGRFATISDLHLGAMRWGAFKSMTDQSGDPIPHPFRCASAAIVEARRWGADLLVVKGDVAQHETDRDFEEFGRLVDRFPDLPMLLIPGNHDVDGRGGSIPLTVGERELRFTRNVDHIDLPGIRIAVADTTIAGHGRGSLVRAEDRLLQTVAESDRSVYIGLHHQLQTTRIPRYWPAGIGGTEAARFLGRLRQLSTPVTISSGHTHRNRSRLEGDILVTEVASTKDWPCVWAGYAVHEGGIRQVVRRIAAPGAIGWAEYSRGAVGGLWGLWSPGPIEQRCLSHAWARTANLVDR
ncbi:MAG: metallophosphoesterase [Actinomycetota bacterium]